ncbi:hypothetical protein BKA81DRAFT_380138 [Phyllosticta paracitricarpa]|uniref:Transmembrane protein n=1 Tax=Phyllosticta citricarpa TaxID=55181 RepID=A0ABR1L774_9PEZI
MAIRDPYFWKRFSAAVHASEVEQAAAEAKAKAQADTEKRKSVFPSPSQEREAYVIVSHIHSLAKSIHGSVLMRRGDRPSWLERQRAKKARRTLICWLFWALFAGLVGAVVAVLLVLHGRGFIK